MEHIKQKLEQARLQRNQIQAQGTVTDQGNSLMCELDEVAIKLSNFFLTHKLSCFAGSMALGAMIIFMVWKSGLVDVGNGLMANGLSGGASEQDRSLVEPPSQFSTADTEGLRKDITLLTEQVQTLTSSVSDLKIKLQRIHPVTDSIAALGNELAADDSQQQGSVSGIVTRLEILPSPAAGMGNVSASDGKDINKSGDATSPPLVAIKEITPAASGIQAQETVIDNGPWVINLASLPRKADAERFMADAESRGVAAGLYQVAVKGKEYWRVQVSGLATAADANAKASLVKEKLGLKDAWVAKR